jgi:TonB family protein
MFGRVLLVAFLSLVSTEQGVAIDPASWFSADDYPTEALASNAEGTVEYEVGIDPGGRPNSCKVTISSGNAALDQATCATVMAKARFRPPEGSDTKFRSKVSWRSPGSDLGTARASIIDLSDARHPKCTMEVRGEMPVGPFECSELLKKESFLKGLSKRYSRVTFLVATAPVPKAPYQGNPAWGDRVSYLASEQYYLRPSFPTACVAIAAEGWNAGRDACAGFPGMRTISEDDAKRAFRTQRAETSVFAVPR